MLHQFQNHNRYSPIQYLQSYPAGGRHLVMEFYDCNANTLDSKEMLASIMKEASQAVGCYVIGELFHKFEPQGVTGVLLLSESHCSIHTWPEHNRASVDFYCCGTNDPINALSVFVRRLESKSANYLLVDRTESIKTFELNSTNRAKL